jgi:hypothetical protein
MISVESDIWFRVQKHFQHTGITSFSIFRLYKSLERIKNVGIFFMSGQMASKHGISKIIAGGSHQLHSSYLERHSYRQPVQVEVLLLLASVMCVSLHE